MNIYIYVQIYMNIYMMPCPLPTSCMCHQIFSLQEAPQVLYIYNCQN